MSRKSATGASNRAEVIGALFENSSDLLHVVDSFGQFKLVNPAWTRLSGWSEVELIGAPVLNFFEPDDSDGPKAERLLAMEPGVVREREVQLRTKDGRLLWMAARTQRLADGDFIVSLRDAAAERARAEELEEARRTRKMLGASAGLGVWDFDPVSSTIWWSDEIVELVGLDPTLTWTPDRFFALIHPRDRAGLEAAMGAAVTTGDPVRTEHRIRARGRWLSMRVTVRTQATETPGVYRLRGISEDITELAQARDAANDSARKVERARREVAAYAQRLNLAMQAAEAGVYEIDYVRKTFWCSPEFERITGRFGSDYRQATRLEYPGFHPDDLEHARAALRDLHQGEKKSGEYFEARIIRPDGAERWVRIFHQVVMTKKGRWLKAVGLMQDCDAHKRQEIALKEAQRAAEAAAEAKAAFLANMSHEIRTPMNGVMGVLHLLKSERLSEDGRNLLNEALDCGGMLTELLNDVIVEAGRGGFDLILMDIQMPGIDGLEATRRIRALGGAAAATPIVALTANVLSHQRQAYLDAGMDGVVGKPISPAAMLAEISEAAARRDTAMADAPQDRSRTA